MGLRDEILKQKEQLEKQEELAKIEKKKQQEIIALEQQKKAEEEKNKKYTEYFALKEQVEAGNIPQDWEQIYQDVTGRIKAVLLCGHDSFDIAVKSTQKLYEEKLNFGVGENCELNLMNKYLTERLIDEGFKKASFKLEKVPEYYATDADYKAQAELQKKYDRQAEEANDKARQQWMYDSFDGVNAPAPSYVYAKLANLPKTGVKYRYEIIAKGSLYDAKEKKKPQGGAPNLKFLQILAIIATVIGVILGALCYIYTQEILMALAYGVGGWLFNVALTGVRASILQIVNYSNNSDATPSDKKKNVGFNIFIIVLWVALMVTIILALNIFAPLQEIFDLMF